MQPAGAVSFFKRIWRWWVALTSERESALVLACFRIAIATVAMGSLLSAATSGVLSILWIERPNGALRLTGGWLVEALGGDDQQRALPPHVQRRLGNAVR